jgi:hypothetical protein
MLLRSMQCYSQYSRYFNDHDEYPLQCDTEVLPLPYPAWPVESLQAMVAALSASPPAPDSGTEVGASAASGAQRRRALLSVGDGEATSEHEDVGASTHVTNSDGYATPEDSCTSGGLACQPDDVSVVATSELASDADLLLDALCYARLSGRVTDADVEEWQALQDRTIAIMASVRSDSQTRLPLGVHRRRFCNRCCRIACFALRRRSLCH